MKNEVNTHLNPLPTGKVEIAGIALFLIALFLRFTHLPFSGPLTVLSLGTLAVIYIIRGFEIIGFQQDEKQFNAVNMITGVILSITCIGILFRLMYWPFSQMHLTIACFGLPIAFGWLFTVRTKVIYKETAHVYFLKLIRVAVFFALAATLYSISLKTQIDIENWDDTKMAELKYKYMSNQNNAQYREEYLEYRKNKLK
ncbi:hypothetical protein [uncultured Cytophaga sp.]|uniref:hypothetical protein n=1 Tax=uncultured Cytophaga sp. TaxID=160238 RepID=UPI0026398BDD|nr:hypothetical protein [uncultured Cytophaga sp.]